MITVAKQNTLGKTVIEYQGEIVARLASGVIVQALWTQPVRDLGYTRFEPGDCFTEYYYTDRWFNIFMIASASGELKGWYCNIAAPAHIFADHIEQVDLLLDVWITPQGEPLILDEDEFAQDTTLSVTQRQAARQGLEALLALLASRQEAFSPLASAR
ncbi:MAG TPA: DUF402 domain-containing protein [Ktedonobacteraceae bacterium]|jgi:predicted RNA-binding protein associated with RNAse of E/G family|nr:DUF402 domain-containing protein [Ktedonobacteraceae bacterium]